MLAQAPGHDVRRGDVEFFSDVVKNVVAKSVEVKKMVYGTSVTTAFLTTSVASWLAVDQ